MFMDNNKFSKLRFYANKGWPIFPVTWLINGQCSCGRSDCNSPGKHPLVDGGFYSATTDLDQIRGWQEKWPDANWGMRTGDKKDGGAGIVVIDIDHKTDGFFTWDLLREENPGPIETVTVATGNGGQHLWFLYPEGTDIRSGAGVLGKGVDIRANLGYVLVPPSFTTNLYRFELNPSETSLIEMPAWIRSKLNGNVRSLQVKHQPAAARLATVINQGERHQSLTSIAGSLKNTGLRDDEIRATLQVIRDERFDSGDHEVTDDEIEGVVQWIKNKQSEYPFTDLGNAERFLAMHEGRVRYCYAWEKWLSWDGRHWKVDDSAEIYRLAHETVRAIYIEASNAKDDQARQAIAKHAIRSEARFHIENMLACVKPYIGVRPEELDTHPMLFNAANGVIDLLDGNLRPHDPALMLTKISDIEYGPGARCPEWEKSMDLFTGGDKESAYFLQKAVGYTLTGRIDEHCLFFLFGLGQNGKTVFTEVIRRLMGDYAKRIDIDALMQNRNLGTVANPYIAAMAGARFVLASEIAESRKVNESLAKDLTGGDAVTARFLFSNPFTFEPSHKIWLYGNHKPKVEGTDLGFWRRIRVVPFPVTISDDVKRPMRELMDIFTREMPGILNWAVLGCVFWQNDGLEMPEAVKTATVEYRTEMDQVMQFITEKCEMHPDYSVNKDTFYTAWKKWCDDQGDDEAKRRTKKWVTNRLRENGFTSGGDGKKAYIGLKVKDD
jgi:putative DNA primase/helicase